MANIEAKNRIKSFVQFGLVIAVLILVNLLANSRIGGRSFYAAWDLTEDKRYTLSENTAKQIENLDEVLFIRVLLEGEFPASYTRLQNSVRELLEDFRSRNRLVEYEFTNILAGDPETVQERQRSYAEDLGITPVTLVEQRANQREIQAVYPYAILYYGGRERVINLL
ncbi:MAG: Gldg family protein, partial [Bacteroidota bacterium]